MYGPKFEFDPRTQRLGAGEENKIIHVDRLFSHGRIRQDAGIFWYSQAAT